VTINNNVSLTKKFQLSQRGCAMLRVVENIALSQSHRRSFEFRPL